MNRSAFSRPLSASLLVAGLVAFGLPLLGGCDRERDKEVITVNDGAGGGGSAAAAEDGQCVRWLEDAVRMLTPGELGRTTDVDKAAQLLSLYLQQEACTGVPAGPLPLAADASETDAARPLLVRLLGEDGADDVTGRRADAADARFLRTRLMDAAAVSGTVGPDAPPEAVAVALNGYVAERLFPLGSTLVEGERPAGSTYHARLRGEGDWADRAWLFADLLRQAGLDSVLLTPWGTGAPDEPSAWVGVLLPGASTGDDAGDAAAVALFDMRTGLPVPSPNDPNRPARLSEVRGDAAAGAAMRDFYQAAELPVPAETAVQDLAPRLIGEPGWWRLMNSLFTLPTVAGPGGRTPRTFDPLHDRAGQPGLVSRVAAAGFESDAITLWPVPAERTAASNPVVPDALSAPLRVGLYVPSGVTIGEDGQLQYEVDGAEPRIGLSHELWAARHAQLAGGANGAREAGGILDELLSAEEVGSLFNMQPLPPARDEDVRGELAKARRNADAVGAATAGLSRDQRTVDAILRAAAADNVAPWPGDRPLPPEVQALHGLAIPDAALFFAEIQLDRGRRQAATERLGTLVFGPPNARKATAASRLAEIVATAGEPATAAGLARQYVGGPDGPRLNVWIARWTAPPPPAGETPPDEETPDEASGGREPSESSEETEEPSPPDAAESDDSE